MNRMDPLDEIVWRRKLAAWLHDPPSKCFDVKNHLEVADALRKTFGFGPEDFKDKQADHIAASADRFPFESTKELYSRFTASGDAPFRHPFGGKDLVFDHPVPSAEFAEEAVNKAFTGGNFSGVDSWRDKFWLLWRRWPEEAAKVDRRLAFLPADTRIPDHTIWNHNSMVSALEGCRQGEEMTPAFLMFQAGPVQSFISEARSIRDLWSGSYLLSWLMARALHEVACLAGPDSVLFPALRGLPLLDVMNKPMWDKVRFGEDTLWERMYPESGSSNPHLLSPTIPNRFLAVVPAGRAEETARAAESVFREELEAIGKQVWTRFSDLASDIGHPVGDDARKRFDRQLNLWPQIAWQVVPWDDPKQAQALWARLPKAVEGDPEKNLSAILDLGKRFSWIDHPACQQGMRWPAYLALCDFALAARRNTRDFAAFDTDKDQAGTPKDPITGREEVIGSEDLWRAWGGRESGVFAKEDSGLGALSIVKRLWCRSEAGILGPRLGLKKADLIESLTVPSMDRIAEKNDNSQNGYVAVLALDGDEMGKWVSGAKTPELMGMFSKEAREYYQNRAERIQRPLSPSYHLQFSEALATFATRFVDPIVRDYEGQTVLAGGDDVLAILPADKALRCAAMLRAAFRGEPPEDLYRASDAFMWDAQASAWNTPFDPWDELGGGWIHERLGESTVPRVVPGPKADVSVGIAVGHYQHPLQQLIHAAQAAEKKAKNDYGRAACQVRLLKRGGEETHWGFKWASPALPLYVRFSELSKREKRSIAGGFPAALAQRFTNYGLLSEHKTPFNDTFLEQLPELLKREFADVMSRQASELSGEERGDLQTRFNHLIEDAGDSRQITARAEDILKLFLASAFLHRQTGDER